MTTLRPYPDYRESGADWIGKVPRHWSLVRLKNGFTLQKRPADKSAGIVTAFRDGEVTLRSNRRVDGYTEGDKQIGYQTIHPGDLVIHAMDAFAGAIGVSDSYGQSTPVYSVCTPKSGFNAHFYGLTLRHIALTGYISSLAKGVRERSTDFRWGDAKELPVPCPPIAEQDQIVEYVRRETGQIDRLIAKQERLIELLAEKRQAIVTHAVTKGLDPSAPTKPSGVPWLGDLPAHWALRKFGHAAEIRGGQVDPRIEPWASTLLIAPNHVQPGTGRILQRQTASEQGADSGKYTVLKGEVIYSKIRPYLRKVVIAPADCLCSADMYAIIGRPGQLSNRYLQQLMLSEPFTDFTADSSARVAMPKINREALAKGFLWYPPMAEQEEILNYIDRESNAINRVERKASAFIGLLKERRSALISAAVTGKIDVREGSA